VLALARRQQQHQRMARRGGRFCGRVEAGTVQRVDLRLPRLRARQPRPRPGVQRTTCARAHEQRAAGRRPRDRAFHEWQEQGFQGGIGDAHRRDSTGPRRRAGAALAESVTRA
jgi:hypothetical protein